MSSRDIIKEDIREKLAERLIYLKQAIEAVCLEDVFSNDEVDMMFERHLRKQQNGVSVFGVEYDAVRTLRELDPTRHDILEAEWVKDFTNNLHQTDAYKIKIEAMQDEIDELEYDLQMLIEEEAELARDAVMESEEMTDKQDALIKEILSETEKFSVDKMDVSFGELIHRYRTGELVIRTESFYKWAAKEQTAIIESMLLSFPIPSIIVSENKEGIWELVDGLQRTLTVISFFGVLNSEHQEFFDLKNKWHLKEGEILKTLKDFDIDSLPTKYKALIKKTPCRVDIIRSLHKDLLKRFN